MKKSIIIIAIIVLLIIGGYFLIKARNQDINSDISDQQKNPQEQTNLPPPPANTPTAQPTSHEVIYTDSGYSPKEITIKVGETVTWKNNSSHGLWTASGIHPSHNIYSGTSLEEHCPDVQNTAFDECKSDQPSQSWSFTFNKKGTWRYHNHIQVSDFGTVIVE